MLGSCAFFSKTWIEVSGSSAKDVSFIIQFLIYPRDNILLVCVVVCYTAFHILPSILNLFAVQLEFSLEIFILPLKEEKKKMERENYSVIVSNKINLLRLVTDLQTI